VAFGRALVGLVCAVFRSAVVGSRRVGVGPVVVERQLAVGRAVDDRRREGIVLGVRVVRQHGDDDRRLLRRRRFVVGGHRRIVSRRHRQRDRRDVAVGRAVVGLVGEAVRAVVVGIRRVGVGPVVVERQLAVGRAVDDRRREGIVLGVRVVRQHGDDDRRLLRRRRFVVG